MPTDGDEITLREWFTSQLASCRALTDERFAAAQKSVDLAYASMERRLEGMNEFRATLSDQQGRYLTIAEYQRAHESILHDVQDLRESRAEMRGKATQESVVKAQAVANWGVLLSAVAAVLALIALAVRLWGK